MQKQAIRADFEAFGDINALWDDLSKLGFGAAEIAAAVMNPRTITSCGYGWPTAAIR